MGRCNTCGNEYQASFDIAMDGQTYTFDSFECAIHKLAPTCVVCGCRILGHGVQAGDQIFCCSNCARTMGIEGLQDHVEGSQP